MLEPTNRKTKNSSFINVNLPSKVMSKLSINMTEQFYTKT